MIPIRNGEYILVEVSFNISTTWWVSLLVDQWVPEGTCSQVLRSSSVDSWRFQSIKIFCVKIDINCIFWGVYYTIPFSFSLFRHFLDFTFQLLKLICLTKDHWRGSSTRNAHMVHIVIESDLKWCIHLGRSLFLYLTYLVSVTAGGPMSPRGHM